MHTANIDGPVVYDALLYTWGDKSNSETIVVNGLGFQTHQNLARALRRLRTVGSVLVWADGVCINQDDVSEKNAQVPMM